MAASARAGSCVPHGGVGARHSPAQRSAQRWSWVLCGCCSRHPLESGSALLCPPAALTAWRSDPAPAGDTTMALSLTLPPFAVPTCGLLAADAASCPPPRCWGRSPPLQPEDWDAALTCSLSAPPQLAPGDLPVGTCAAPVLTALCCSQTLPAPSCRGATQGSCVISWARSPWGRVPPAPSCHPHRRRMSIGHGHGALVSSPDPHVGPQEQGETLALQSVSCLGVGLQRDPQKRLPGGVSHRRRHAVPGVYSQSLLLSCRNLSAIQDREICCYSISCKEKDNIGECRRLQCGARGAVVAGAALAQAVCPSTGGGDGQRERLLVSPCLHRHHPTVAYPALEV